MIVGPSAERAASRLRAVIEDQDFGTTPLTGHAVRHLNDPFARQRDIHRDGGALGGAVILEVGGAELAPIASITVLVPAFGAVAGFAALSVLAGAGLTR